MQLLKFIHTQTRMRMQIHEELRTIFDDGRLLVYVTSNKQYSANMDAHQFKKRNDVKNRAGALWWRVTSA
jgi:hypothetical protein